MLSNRNLRQSLNYAFLKAKPCREAIDQFKAQADKLLNAIEENKTEEFYKTNLTYFLNETYYKNKHYINVKESNDLVIHNDKTANSSVGVIIEVKRPSNKSEMITCDDLNKKALQELILYYLRERITHQNLHIKHLIVTNINDWFIFDARIFEKYFYENKALVNDFIEFENGSLAGHRTISFYKDIAAPAIEQCKAELEFTYFSLQNYKNYFLPDSDKENDKKLIPLFKILSPEHLLKLSFSNDANSLNKEFYNELLHIIGLEEVKEGGKKLIKRKVKERNLASFLEQSINEIKSLGEAENEEQLFDLAIELSITWINRILFLKLLEAQLMTYHKKDNDYQFFNQEKITCFSDLNHLFFQVLAIKPEERDQQTKHFFLHVPYLNSSLFERTELEKKTLYISQLRREKLPILSMTVLKNQQGKKRTGELDILTYLFDFLDAYDFSNDGIEDIKEDNKALISASVLGLIFEKINGYKDGSFFTPSVITMYMSRESIRLAVLQKFNERKNWKFKRFEDLQNNVEFRTLEEIKEANEIINSLKICDPAVGSGHFLVSVLNEIIVIKSELRVLADRNYYRLMDWQFSVYNDELKITLVDDDNIQFEYKLNSKNSQRVQETLFHEKQTIIENCLFGVDINANSVKICCLRLWIELLKSAYYIKNPDPELQHLPRHLETLPNLDINIKTGNSLVSRFKLTDSLKNHKLNIEAYKKEIFLYQSVKEKNDKKSIEKRLDELKRSFFKGLIDDNSERNKLTGLTAKLADLNNFSLFEESTKERKDREKLIKNIELDIAEVNDAIENIKNGDDYKNAFEWRFEFPEALNDDGDFIGFDVVVGNPPYIFARNSKEKGLTQENKSYFYNNFELAEYQVNLYPLFIELGNRLLKQNGVFSYITPNNWLTINTNKKLRRFVLAKSDIKIVNFYAKVFEHAAVDTAILLFKKSIENNKITLMEYVDNFEVINESVADDFLNQNDCLINIKSFKNIEIVSIIEKVESNAVQLNLVADIKVGLKSYQIGKGHPSQVSDIKDNRIFHSKEKLDDSYLKYFEGKDICRYFTSWSGEFLKYGNHLAEPRNNFDLFSTKRILVRQIPSKPPYCVNACLVDEVALNDLNSMNIINMTETPELILAILNSKLISYWFVHKFGKMQRDTFPQFKVNELAIFPMPKTFEPHRENLVTLVNQIMKSKQAKKDTNQWETEIDKLVYDLYDLNPEEIAIVEAGQK